MLRTEGSAEAEVGGAIERKKRAAALEHRLPACAADRHPACRRVAPCGSDMRRLEAGVPHRLEAGVPHRLEACVPSHSQLSSCHGELLLHAGLEILELYPHAAVVVNRHVERVEPACGWAGIDDRAVV